MKVKAIENQESGLNDMDDAGERLLTGMSRSIKHKALSRFGASLDLMRRAKGLSINEMAAGCSISPTYMGSILHGQRKPSLETIFVIADFFKVQYQDIIFLLIDSEDIVIGNATRKVTTILLNDSRKKTNDALVVITEEELKEKYKDYSPDNFLEYVKMNLRDFLYKEEYEEYRKLEFVNSTMPTTEDAERDERTALLKKIITRLYSMDESALQYTLDQINIYEKYLRR